MTKLVLAVLVLTGCSLLPGGGTLDGEWTLLSGIHGGQRIQLIDEAPVTLIIDGSQVSGQAACNSFSGNATINGDHFRLGDLASTAMGCDPPVMALESAYHAALGAVTDARRTADQLTLTGDSVELVYQVRESPPAAALVGTDWQLESVVTGGTATHAADFERAGMTFAADGTMTAVAGCVHFEGAWVIVEGVILVSEIPSRMTLCAQGSEISAQSGVISVLAGGFEARIDGGLLRVHPEHGIGLEYRAAPAT